MHWCVVGGSVPVLSATSICNAKALQMDGLRGRRPRSCFIGNHHAQYEGFAYGWPAAFPF
eukprot:11186852-Lingulodinium_polyedra.AAC.1